ncbi:hypothetical protein [Atlantibacter hermannii]|uniref:hypothetical protein n=1 Tax=Atlantibacter hermannii TaxID=565 RepID=UPI00289DEB04|nr:hypothetical protein [Atlantibacter hermannii]
MAFSINETTLLNAIKGGGIFSVINSVLYPGYGIYYADGSGRAINPTSFLGVEYGAEAVVVNAPVEKGSYTSYNKVKRPPLIRVLFVLEGLSGFTGALPNITNFSLTSRSSMLSFLDIMVESTDLYDIETPDTTYEKYDLIRYNYRTSERDVTLLTVEAIFQAVLEDAEVTISSTTAESGTTNNKISKAPSTVTEKVASSASESTQSDLSSALAGIRDSIPDSLEKAASSVNRVIDGATKAASAAIDGASTSAIDKVSQTATQLLRVIT